MFIERWESNRNRALCISDKYRRELWVCSIIALLLILLPRSAVAVDLSTLHASSSLGPHARILELSDPEATPTQADFSEFDSLYRPNHRDEILHPRTTGSLWVSFALDNHSRNQVNRIIALDQPGHLSIELFRQTRENNWISAELSPLPLPATFISLAPQTSERYLLKITGSDFISFRLAAMTPSAYQGLVAKQNASVGGAIATLILVTLSVLYVSVITRSRSMLNLLGFCFNALLFCSLTTHLLPNIVNISTSAAHQAENLTLFLLCASGCRFMLHWLRHPSNTRFLSMLSNASLVLMLVALLVPLESMTNIALATTGLCAISILFTTIINAIYGNARAQLILLDIALLTVFVLSTIIISITQIHFNLSKAITLSWGFAILLLPIIPLAIHYQYRLNRKISAPLKAMKISDIHRWYHNIKNPIRDIVQTVQQMKNPSTSNPTLLARQLDDACSSLHASATGLLTALQPFIQFQPDATFRLDETFNQLQTFHGTLNRQVSWSTEFSSDYQTEVIGSKKLIQTTLSEIMDCLKQLSIASNVHVSVAPSKINPHLIATITVAAYTNDISLSDEKNKPLPLIEATEKLSQHGIQLSVEMPAKFLALIRFDVPLSSKSRPAIQRAETETAKLLYVDTSNDRQTNLIESASLHSIVATRVNSSSNALSAARLHKRLRAPYDIVIIENELEATDTLQLGLTIRQENLLSTKGTLVLLTASPHHAKRAAQEHLFDLIMTKPTAPHVLYHQAITTWLGMTGKRACISDPDFASALTCQAYLSKLGYQVDTIYSHDKLASVLSRTLPDLLLIDFDSYVAYKDKALPWALNQTSVVVATFSEQEASIVSDGGLRYFIKPASLKKLKKCLEEPLIQPEKSNEHVSTKQETLA